MTVTIKWYNYQQTDLIMEVWEGSLSLVLESHLFVGRQVKHSLKLLSGHESVGVEEWITSYISCEPVNDGTGN